MAYRIIKRDGTTAEFDKEKITSAIFKAASAVGGNDRKMAESLADKVIVIVNERFANRIPTVENIQDIVEQVLIKEGHDQTAKAYILYRARRAEVRAAAKKVPEDVKNAVQESKKYFRNPLSEFIYYRTYSRWMDDMGRRETWVESVDRYMDFMKENLGDKLSTEEYSEIREAILYQEVMPSMRLLWSAGPAARKSNVCAYNCSYIAPTVLEDFAEIMYLSMCGAGVGFSVESQSVQMLPIVKRQTGEKLPIQTIDDSKEGWCDALTLGLRTWYEGKDAAFDYSKIRPAGSKLHTMGGRSSGPGPLKNLLDFARRKILESQGRRMRNIDIHDIICKIGEVVVMGGVRRTALISLSDLNDEEMRDAKTGQFYTTEPQRSMANNSVVYMEKPTSVQFMEEWLALAKSGTGERGIFNRGDLAKQIPARRWEVFKDYAETSGTNPCVTGDALVYVADGRGHVPIKMLADEGKDVPVFVFDDKGKLTVRHMRNPRITGKIMPIYKITLDDGSSIKATKNHKFKLTSGEYCEVEKLKGGDSLRIVTKFEASIKDIFPDANSRSQNYWWINNSKGANIGEHRLIASAHYDTKIPAGYVVHHKDRNAQNNLPENLEILSKENHDALHSKLMIGDNNPMRRATHEWDNVVWANYKRKHSENNREEKNRNFSGVSNEELKKYALSLTRSLGRRFSARDWSVYAKEHGLLQHFSKWRNDHLGGITGLAKWAAAELQVEHIDDDPRVVESYKKWTSEGYDCKIADGRVFITKKCEMCGREFNMRPSSREYGVCGISCGLKRKYSDNSYQLRFSEALLVAHDARKKEVAEKQARIYSELKFRLKREPLKTEWTEVCKKRNISPEISRGSSPFRSYSQLREASEMYNHKVVSVEFFGYEDVYNGTVDEFHNFFVGGFASKTRNGKRKFTYLNNLQCGEIILRSKEFCNLTEVVCRAGDAEDDLLRKMKIATILGTYQSSMTNFPYLSKQWKKNCEEERLLGVSLTGQWDCVTVRNPETLKKLKEYAVQINGKYAERFGINPSVSITCVKPSGTVSQLVDSSSGMHARHSKYYIRRIRIAAHDPLFKMMRDQKMPYHPEVGQTMDSASTFVIEFPVKAPEGAVVRDDLTFEDQLEYWKMVKKNYTEHNPSVTISIGEDEWISSAQWLYNNWEILGGLSFLPRSDFVYQLAPYEPISKEQYDQLAANMPQIDFANIVLYETEDQTEGAKEAACVGGICEFLYEDTEKQTVAVETPSS